MRRPTVIVLTTLASLAAWGCGGAQIEDRGGANSTLDSGASTAGADFDGDTILDIHEGDGDPDGDGLPNWQDTDSDGDTISDATEAGDSDPVTLPIDSDVDGTPDFLDRDSDDNCITDPNEKHDTGAGPGDADGDGVADYADNDNDGDGIPDTVELRGTCDLPLDSDGDRTPDFMDTDSDNDGIGDIYESGMGDYVASPVDTDGDGTPDYLDLDSDGDGISDADEGGTGGDPSAEPRDTDSDGIYDFQDTDSDGDGLSDKDEASVYLTDPYDADTDGDGFSDGAELAAGTDPLDPSTVIKGIYVEVGERTEVEQGFDFDLRIQMGDIGFMIDTTGSMSGTANAMAGEFSQIITELALTIPDAQYGYATHDDYPYGSMGQAGVDQAFELHQQVTSSTSSVQAAMSATRIHSGMDSPESSMEALYQAFSGVGYDMNCDSVYEDTSDVRPFLASKGDPFGGLGGQGWSVSSPGGGTLGGMGFRDLAVHIVVEATDSAMRDPEAGYATPGGCPQDAGFSDVVAAAGDLGASLVGISVSDTLLPEPQMLDLAAATGSYADTDGDGRANNPLVFEWSGTDEDFRDTITQAIEDLIGAVRFDTVSLQVVGDEWGFVSAIDPEKYDDISDLGTGDTTLSFTLTFRGVVAATTEDQIFALTLNVLGDDSILLDSTEIIVVVPGMHY
ncbi:MAG: hypothetical protein GXP62_02925 [Oligoflexia bacterium]|nr:hypothetical protein [Oligoflexia bacterium]